jgi:hypothetical protein
MPKVHFTRNCSGCLALTGMIGALLFSSCGKQPPTAGRELSTPETPATTNPVATLNPPVATGPGPDEKACFECTGIGTVVCRAPGCKAGQVDCPGNCLRLSRGSWKHLTVAGHDPADLWISFKAPNRTKLSWNQNHVGDVIEYQNGAPVNIGRCKLCGGSTTVPCPSCKGEGRQTCQMCSGKKFVPVAWTVTDNPWFNSQPDLIRLGDGQAVPGRIAASVGEEKTIITRDKKILHVQASDILPAADTNATATPLR